MSTPSPPSTSHLFPPFLPLPFPSPLPIPWGHLLTTDLVVAFVLFISIIIIIS